MSAPQSSRPARPLAKAIGCLLLALASAASAATGAERPPPSYRQLELFARVLSYVENNYVEPVDAERLMHGAIKGMLDTLDPHTVFMPPDVFREMKIDTAGEFGGLGIEIARKGDRLVVVAPVDDTPASRAGVLAGDEIVRIDDVPTRGMDLGQALQRLRGLAGQRVSLTLMRDGFLSPREIVLVRDHIRIISVEGALYGGIAHVKIKNFQDRTDQYLRKELERLRQGNGGREFDGLVLDLRNNPGGLLDQAVAVSDRFLPGNLTIVTTRGRDGRNATHERSRERDTEHPYPLVVLVNAGSASASEIVAGALQDHRRAVIMGTPTFGKGSVQTVIELEDGSGLKLTIARYFTPQGRSIQESGIAPDFVVADDVLPAAGPRERDLQRHFKAEPGADAAVSAAAALSQVPPANLERWDLATPVADTPLRVALNYLHALPSMAQEALAPVHAGD